MHGGFACRKKVRVSVDTCFLNIYIYIYIPAYANRSEGNFWKIEGHRESLLGSYHTNV